MIKKTYKIKGMDCPSCAVSLECDLECLCKSAKCNYAKSTLEVVFGSIDQEKKVFETVKRAGYKIE
jgi:copper chaperone CopZ